MNKLSFRKVFFTSAVAVAVLFSGCGSDDDKSGDDSNVTAEVLGDVTGNTDNGGTVAGTDGNTDTTTSGGIAIGSSRVIEVAANAGGSYFVTNLNPDESASKYKKIGGEDKDKFIVLSSGYIQFGVQTDTPKDENGDDIYHLIVEETAAGGTVTNIELNVTVI